MAAALTAARRRLLRAALRPQAVWIPQAGISHDAERLHLPPPPPAKYGGRHTVTLIPGDGIGPELMLHVKEVFRHACVPVDFEEVRVNSEAPEDDVQNAITAIRRNGVALKGNIETNHNLPPSHKSRNNLIRTSLDLYANVIHCQSLPGVETRHQDIDILIVRENTEGEYSSLEHEEAGGRAVPAVLPGSGGRVPRDHVPQHDRGQHHHAAGVTAAAVRRDGDAQPLREHRQQRLRRARGGARPRARCQLRPRLRRVRDRHAEHREEHRQPQHRQPHGRAAGGLHDAGPPAAAQPRLHHPPGRAGLAGRPPDAHAGHRGPGHDLGRCPEHHLPPAPRLNWTLGP
ncbi:isocitrate dehydrogenase [NAD] subunit gamma, mitochondrial isoform 2-T2 [Cyanocitta cristata]